MPFAARIVRQRAGAGENGDHPGERLIIAYIAGEDHVGNPDRLGCGVGRAEDRDQAGKQLARHLRAPDPQAMGCDVVGGDPALGDDPGGPSGQRPAGDAGQGAGNGAADGQVIPAVRGAHDGAARVEQDIRMAKRGDNLLRRLLRCTLRCLLRRRDIAAALDDGGSVELDAGDPATGAEIGYLPLRLRNV
jgi:hypothetical protein